MNKKRILSKYKKVYIKNKKALFEDFVTIKVNDYLCVNRFTGRIYMTRMSFFLESKTMTQNEKISKLYNGFIEGFELIYNDRDKFFVKAQKKYISFKTHKSNYSKLRKLNNDLYDTINVFMGKNRYPIEKLWIYSYSEMEEIEIEGENGLKRILENPEWKVIKIEIDNIKQVTDYLRKKYKCILSIQI